MSEVTRGDIADAIDGVLIPWAGQDHELSATTAQPAALAVWQAWPDWQSARWLTGCVVERTWQVFVILPAADPPSWTTATDAALTVVRDALLAVGMVERAEPIALRMADQALTMPAVAFTLRTS